MAIRTIYLNPNDTLKIKVIKDPELPKTEAEFWHQHNKTQFLMNIDEHGNLRMHKALMQDVYSS